MLSKLQAGLVGRKLKSKIKTTFLSHARSPSASHNNHISLTESSILLRSIGWESIFFFNILNCERTCCQFQIAQFTFKQLICHWPWIVVSVVKAIGDTHSPGMAPFRLVGRGNCPCSELHFLTALYWVMILHYQSGGEHLIKKNLSLTLQK